MGLSDALRVALIEEVPGLYLLSTPSGWYVGIGQAEAAAAWLEGHDVRVVGFEGLRTDGRSLLASVDHIADFSAAPGRESDGAPTEVMGQILRAWATEVEFVEIVVAEGGGPASTER